MAIDDTVWQLDEGIVFLGALFEDGRPSAPTTYLSMAYREGALVLHLLRGVLRALTKSDDTFLALLRDFVHTYRDDAPSTADFQAMVTKHAPADWSWFFDQ